MSTMRWLALGLLCAASANALAEGSASRQEAAGVGVGAIVGGLAGGPAGAIIGAAFGAKLGDSLHQREQTSASLEASLDSSRTDVRRLSRDVAQLEHDKEMLGAELTRLEAGAAPELAAMLDAGIQTDLLFRTGEHTLTETTRARLQSLAAALEPLEDIHVRLDGFADERGDADYNLVLSQKRAEFVRDTLVAAGIPASRIEVSAHGETNSPEDTADSYALERRVSLTLKTGGTPGYAANTAQ